MAAMHRFHDSRFNGVRLVCRLRRSSAPASGVPTGPSAMMGGQHSNTSRPATPKQDGLSPDLEQNDREHVLPSEKDDQRLTLDTKNKYFIVKSLTLQDLELSVRNGIWSTQSHNEEILNNAFASTENVYLIFSANKSGEYFGYARMASAILVDGAPFVSSIPKVENVADAPDVPKSIPTPATEWAPKGRIIDDSARGTIFWEAELPEDATGDDKEAINNSNSSKNNEDDGVAASSVEADGSIVAQSWGKPFKIDWISTNRLPFYRTRGLRNPWNANREVKIARDGTELEPSVGERLIHMFHRLGPSTAATTHVQTMPPPHPPMSGGSGLLPTQQRF